jgi:nicotinamide riboside kinase
MIDPSRRATPARLAVIGAECTGKSALCEALAERLPGQWAPEELRAFCAAKGRTPLPEEQATLAARQVLAERACAARAQALGQRHAIFDATPLVTAAYSLFCFDDASLLPAAVAHQRTYDLTLLADIDLPWEPDGIQRDGPAIRVRFDALLRDLLRAHELAWVPVRGLGEARVASAEAAVRALPVDRLQSRQR